MSADILPVYEFLHKTIRNVVPGKALQRRCIEKLRASLFPEVLEDIRITAVEAVREGTAVRRKIHDASYAPPARVKSIETRLPEGFGAPEAHIPELYEYIFPDGYCFRTFALDCRRRFIADTSAAFNDLYRNNKDIRSRRPVIVNEDAVALNTWHASGYYTWLVELAGRLLLCPGWRDKLICVDDNFTYQDETFSLLGVPEEQVLVVADYRLYKFRSLSVVNAPPLRCCVPALDAVRGLSGLLPREDYEDALPKRLYLGRGDIGNRNVENGSELLALLEKYGFQEILCSQYPMHMQIRLARNADYIVCTHGAAGTNLLFCRPNVRFLEMFPPEYVDATYISITQYLNIEHHILRGAKSITSDKNSNFIVDTDKVQQAVELLLRA
ncbi:MAG: glycosyltransferase family 61 protein [Desulfovibrio sp.]|jgi:hypothetical protein|nr:glycosyltransferase family 61 protein [Desulfovibrio sp.]